jgi:hypothetical protein
MVIVFDHYIDQSTGFVFGTQSIDTADPAVQAMLTAVKASPAVQTSAGYSVMSNHPSYPAKTRWQVILVEVARLNDPIARGILGV